MQCKQPAPAFIQRWPKAGDAERLLTAATSAQEAAQLARLRFDSGVTDFLILLDAEREVLNNRDQLAQAQTDTATALVGVYQALGGRWAVAGPRRLRSDRAAGQLEPPSGLLRGFSTSCRVNINPAFPGSS
jgi:hypothetical protein